MRFLRKRETRLLVEYFTVAFIPIIIFYFSEFIPYNLPYLFLSFWVLFVLFIIWKEGMTLEELGLGRNNLRNGLIWYILIAVVGVTFIYFAALALKRPIEINPFQHWHFKFLFIPISVAQEFIYRGFMLTTLKKVIKRKYISIGINTLAFIMLHIFFPDFLTTLHMIVWFGLIMDVVYWDHPNLVGASVTHSIINFAVVSVSWI